MVKTSPRIVVVVPTYNERTNLPVLVDLLMDLHVPNLRIPVVDDNSPDGTGDVADRLAAETASRSSGCACGSSRRWRRGSCGSASGVAEQPRRHDVVCGGADRP
ncbi:glycosyltransferase [Streptomyces atratus]|uniref:glycosyltransferase n=1 Tax=Streptomyces atratus TaxID=1893 RepID=UPI0033D2B2E3